MPTRARNRGPDPRDAEAFGPAAVPRLRTACAELSWLLERGYASAGSLTLVGNHHQLTRRQREAVERAACGDVLAAARRRSRLDGRHGRAPDLSGRDVVIDGFNALIVAESLLGGAPVFRGRDGALRDLAGVGGTWRRVEQTTTALAMLAEVLGPARSVAWILDAPVSNSGRLAGMLRETGAAAGTDWSVETVADADPAVVARASELGASALAASADGQVIDGVVAGATDGGPDRVGRWVDLPAQLASNLEAPWIVELGELGRA